MRSLGVGVFTGALVLVGCWLLDAFGIQRNLFWYGALGGVSAWVAASVLPRLRWAGGGD